jgi:hypothetical protein
MRTIALLLVLMLVELAQAEPQILRQRRFWNHSERNRNYILRRQQVFIGLGTPTLRLIYGKREIDVYRNGLRFEKDNVVGVSRR